MLWRLGHWRSEHLRDVFVVLLLLQRHELVAAQWKIVFALLVQSASNVKVAKVDVNSEILLQNLLWQFVWSRNRPYQEFLPPLK